MRRARNATDAGERRRDQRRRQVGEVSAIGWSSLVEHHLFLDAVVDLDREVDAEPDQDRQARDGHERQVDADQPMSEKLHSTPTSTATSGSNRHRTLEHDDEHDGHDDDGDQRRG